MRRLVLGVLTASALTLAGLGIADATGVKVGHPSSEAWRRAALQARAEEAVGSAQSAQSMQAAQSDPVGERGTRVWGSDRFATAVAISQSLWTPENAGVVFLANGLNFPDALAAGPSTLLAGPLLLVTPNSLPQVTADEITRLQPCEVVAFGGPASISDAVLQEAQALTTATC